MYLWFHACKLSGFATGFGMFGAVLLHVSESVRIFWIAVLWHGFTPQNNGSKLTLLPFL
jgi:hypothetical protein